jgi:hypothetical protein
MRRCLLCALSRTLSLFAPGCRNEGPAHLLNFVLFGLDTTRFDAVSAH